MREPPHLIVAYGLGVDSTALLVRFVRAGIRPDAILFADVGSEKQSTYAYLPVMQAFLAEHKFPPVTVVRYVPRFAPYTTIEGNCTMNATLPGATFGKGSCTLKWKIQPQNKWVRDRKEEYPGKIRKAIGFEATENYRKLRANDKVHSAADDKYEYWYPLIEWGWDRDECKARIAEMGLTVPPKSACWLCPNAKPEELHDMTPEELGRIIRMEVMAEPYNRKVEGLWRRIRKKDGRPGSMTEYIVRSGLDYVHPDKLPRMDLNPNCQKFKNGYTFAGPHNKLRLADLIGGCECTKWENQVHASLVESLFADDEDEEWS